MAIMLQLKYDELRAIAKQFRDSGEDITLLFTKTRDRAMDLRGMWKGDAADKFFEEMDLVLLPPLKQTGVALFAMQDVLLKVMKYIYDADQDTVKYFKQDVGFLGEFTGAGVTGAVAGGISGVQPGVRPHVGLGGITGQQGTGSTEGEMFGAGGEGSTGGGSSGAQGAGGDDQQSSVSGSAQDTRGVMGGGSGAGTGGVQPGHGASAGSSSGGGMNSGKLGESISQSVSFNSPLKPDHIYESTDAGGTSQAGGQPSTASVIGEVEKNETGAQVGAAATSVAGGAGMAAVGKVGLRSRKKVLIKRRISQ